MMKDDELKTATDYSAGQKEAAYRVLGEIVNLLAPYGDNFRIVGGWVPSLYYPEMEHIGSIDVDVLLNEKEIHKATGYENIKRILTRNGYKQHPENFFTFVKKVTIENVDYDVDVDFLAGKYGGDGANVSKHVDGIKALPATAGDFAFEFPSINVAIPYSRPDGALDTGHISVVAYVPYLVMKTAALGRGKPKDAYDIYFTIKNYPGGVRALAEEFMPFADKELIKNMCQKLKEKFESPQHAGSVDIVSFLEVEEEEEIEQTKQDAFQQIKYLTDRIMG